MESPTKLWQTYNKVEEDGMANTNNASYHKKNASYSGS